MSLSKQLRAAVKAAESVNSVAVAAGVPQPMLCRFAKGNGISLATADRLAEYFGLELQPKAKAAKGRKGKRA